VPQSWATETPREFITFLSEGQTQPLSPAFIDACKWFSRFIDVKYQTSWSTLILPNVVFPKEEREGSPRPTSALPGRLPTIREPTIPELPSVSPSRETFAIVDHVLTSLARGLQNSNHFALVDVENDLVNDQLVKDDEENERAALHKLVFAFAGWLSKQFILLEF
jgi:hypothetical protein